MTTHKLYWDEPFATTFAATVLEVAELGGAPSIVLDRTLFYPEGGGQLGDRGTLTIDGRDVAVRDTQVDDAGTVHHLLEGPIDGLRAGGPVGARIDRDRRRDFMSQHTGQHLLSRALIEIARAETVSARLGEAASTIDTPLTALAEAALARAEDLVNDLILDDVAVRSHLPTPEELAAMPLRRAPKVTSGVRVIEVEGFDFTPCGGTHVARTGQIGPVKITGIERYKGGTRVTFLAGRRALADARGKDAIVRDLAKSFTCGASEVPLAVAKLRAELKARTDAFAVARGELMQLIAERTLAAHPPDPSGTRVFVVREGDDLPTLRALSGALARRPDVVAFVASRDRETGEVLLVVERGSGVAFDAGAWFKKTAQSVGGRGGGRPERAEGRLPATVDLPSSIESLG
ncbi:MAG: alanyl-tRNA editing protein [Deltaproteobacteria bacterium]|nr:alanyl-tRNA editing protein [Deltaproteobacteria bacterium]